MNCKKTRRKNSLPILNSFLANWIFLFLAFFFENKTKQNKFNINTFLAQYISCFNIAYLFYERVFIKAFESTGKYNISRNECY